MKSGRRRSNAASSVPSRCPITAAAPVCAGGGGSVSSAEIPKHAMASVRSLPCCPVERTTVRTSSRFRNSNTTGQSLIASGLVPITTNTVFIKILPSDCICLIQCMGGFRVLEQPVRILISFVGDTRSSSQACAGAVWSTAPAHGWKRRRPKHPFLSSYPAERGQPPARA